MTNSAREDLERLLMVMQGPAKDCGYFQLEQHELWSFDKLAGRDNCMLGSNEAREPLMIDTIYANVTSNNNRHNERFYFI